ncbi:MAG: serine/threonine protein kinase [Gemmatimonadetes bacterium]|nr:serine/threonine protein kinase [Gemmatimonadota bacterium]
MSEQKVCPTCGTEYPLSERFCPRDGTALRSSNPQGDIVGSIVHEKFHVMKKLGEGGMGAVYLAEHVKMGRKVALKVMNPGMHQDPDAIARFNREAKNASQLSHPNVCPIYDFGETPEGMIYLAMEFIEGSSLSGLIEKAGALTPARAASIIHQAADALQVAHDYGIVHRDLKPDNIMIAKARDGSDMVKVVDFGIAKASSSDAQKVTKTGLVVGTPEYMSPEQLAGDKLDGRSDIYSLALVAFNCFTGKLPFPSNSAQEAMIMRLTDQPKTLAEMKPDVAWPDELQAVMDKALARDAAERYASAAQFGRDMSKSVENMPSTIAAEAGTQVIGAGAVAAAAAAKTAAAPAVPKTRVASSAERGGAAAAPAAAPVAEAPKKGGLPIPAIAAAAVILIGGGGYFVMNMGKGGDPASVTQDSLSKSAGAAPAAGGTETTPPANNPAVQPMSKQMGGGTPSAPNTKAAGAATGTPTTQSPPAAAAPDFDTWKDWTDPSAASEANAEKAITAINAALPTLTGQDRARANYYLGSAQLITGRQTAACTTLSRARAEANNALKALIDPYFTMDGAPCK